jgi:hypothetical protein
VSHAFLLRQLPYQANCSLHVVHSRRLRPVHGPTRQASVLSSDITHLCKGLCKTNSVQPSGVRNPCLVCVRHVQGLPNRIWTAKTFWDKRYVALATLISTAIFGWNEYRYMSSQVHQGSPQRMCIICRHQEFISHLEVEHPRFHGYDYYHM